MQTANSKMNYSAYFFDMDQTLTRSKTEITDAHFKMLCKLAWLAPVIVVSGATFPQMRKQLPLDNVLFLAQNGNHAIDVSGEMWLNSLTPEEVAAVDSHIEQIGKSLKYKVNAETVQHRGCQVSFSLVGHDAPLELKEAFDPSRNKRKAILQAYPFIHPELTVRIGGTTCLDYTRKSGTKGENVKKVMQEFQLYNPIYVGDALFPGGNDESVIGVCATLQVDSVDDTYKFIKSEIEHGNN